MRFMTAKRMVAGAVLCGWLCGCGLEGLHSANPHTKIKAGAFSLYNSKDTQFKNVKGKYNPKTGEAEVDIGEASDVASVVRTANVDQIMARAEEARAAWAGANQMLGQVAAMLPMIQGIQAQAQQPTLNRQALIRDVVMEVLAELRRTTTQPVP